MTEKKVAILQSNYIPWKGYFDLIGSVDEFVLYDIVQYTTRDWRNRNIIKTPQGNLWLTIPVKHVAMYQKIYETEVPDSIWAVKHIKSIRQYYSKTRYFAEYESWISDMYREASEMTLLSDINRFFISEICSFLNIKTKITCSYQYVLSNDKNLRIIDICKQAGADIYVSGPAAKSYIDEGMFERENIKLVWADYSGYPEYPQLYPPFNHHVSILDLIFNTGPDCRKYMKSIL